MEIKITHTITLAPEVLTILQAFLGKGLPTAPTATGSAPSAIAESKTVAKVETPAPVEPAKVETPAPVEPAKVETPAPVATTTTEPVSFELVRKIAAEKQQGGKREQLKALLTEFNVEKLTGLSEAQFAPFFNKVKAL